ncbi:MAG: hypothetical protein FWF35_04875 [Elusimicrobia bacterium]|nr:hypothetical protein [Elusimicrobiota bacterium]
MKKFISLICFAALSASAGAATIETVAFHPVPSGQYAQLYISQQLNVNNGTLTMYKLRVPGSLFITSAVPDANTDGTLTITNADASGLTSPLNIGISAINGSAANLTANNYAYLRTAQTTASPAPNNTFTMNGALTANKIVAWRAQDSDVTLGNNAPYIIPQVPASQIMRWVKIRDVNGKDWTVLAASNNSTAITNACAQYADATAKSCCTNPNQAACRAYISQAISFAGINSNPPNPVGYPAADKSLADMMGSVGGTSGNVHYSY